MSTITVRNSLWHQAIKDSSVEDLFDHLRGLVTSSRLAEPSSESLRERLVIVAEMDSRGVPANVIEAAITVGTWEGDNEATKRREERPLLPQHIDAIGCMIAEVMSEQTD